MLIVIILQVDFPRVIEQKIMKIRKCGQPFNSHLSEPIISGGFLDSINYSAIGCDITDTIQLQELLEKCSVDYSRPTLIISECVLTYITPLE